MEIIAFLLLGGYGYGAWRFWKGFRRTNFSQGRLMLALLWPALVISNKAYRQNFRKALKG